MRLAGRRVTFFLSEDGREFVSELLVFSSRNVVTVEVEETDDVGIWVRVERKSIAHVLLLRWEFILGIELPVDSGKVIGLRG